MAEVAAGLWAAEEAVSTTAQAGVATYMIAQPTNGLKATFIQIGSAPDDKTRASLARSDHTLTVLSHKAYIFGGEVADGELADNSVHVVSLLSAAEAEKNGESQYALVPALPDGETGGEASGVRKETSDGVPAPRSRHAACGINVCVAVFGGSDESGNVIDEKGRVWLFNTAKACWEALDPPEESGESLSVQEGSPNYPEARCEAGLFEHNNDLILYGGYSATGEALKDIWHFSYSSRSWTRLPDAPAATTNAALTNETLFLLTSSAENSGLSGYIHSLPLARTAAETRTAKWTSQSFPSNPLTPAPKSRVHGGLLPITTGHGRRYLLHFLGEQDSTHAHFSDRAISQQQQAQYADLWTLQLPSTKPRSSSIAAAFNPAAIKDAIRSVLPKSDSGTHGWAEVDVMPPSLDSVGDGEAGKVHPGPRAFFGCDVLGSESKNVLGVGERAMVVLWGGVNAKGEREGDGWMVTVE